MPRYQRKPSRPLPNAPASTPSPPSSSSSAGPSGSSTYSSPEPVPSPPIDRTSVSYPETPYLPQIYEEPSYDIPQSSVVRQVAHIPLVLPTEALPMNGQSSPPVGPASSSSSSPQIVPPSVIGGGGVRVPYTDKERKVFDEGIVKRWNDGLYDFTVYTGASGVRSTAVLFDPQALYKSAAAQLDKLIPALVTPGELPAQTSLRAISIRLALPNKDVPMKATAKTSKGPGPRTAGYLYDDPESVFRGYDGGTATKAKLASVLLELLECIVDRISMEGLVVYEEWWNPRAKIMQYIVRC